MDPANANSRRLVLGTAGHIDHGKTSLVRALTGVDTDRLPEEKSRGITIELGFAPLDLESGIRLSIVDVPGHEGLVRTMVAGATGIDLLLLVVAADEGVMPQTREHLAICELLGLSRAIVALTKADTVDADMLDLAHEEVQELLAETPLRDASILPVSATQGDGMQAVRDAITALARDVAAQPSRPGPARLAIDRRFEKRGFGSVVTGTLVGAPLSVGENLEILPAGVAARIRGLQSHGESVETAPPGVRCAVNLQGVALEDVERGHVLASPGRLCPTRTLDAEIAWLPVAPALKESMAVEFLAGTAERRARLAPIGAAIEPGRRGYARIHIDGETVTLLPGDRFIIRGFTRTAMGGATLGGGRTLDIAPPHRRRSDPALRAELEILARGDARTGVAARVKRAGLRGIDTESLERETGLACEPLAQALEAASDELLGLPNGICISLDAMATLERGMIEALDAYHVREPLRPGMPTGTLRGTLPDNVADAVRATALSRLAERGEIEVAREHVKRKGHRVELDPAAQATADQLITLLAESALEPPNLRELAEAVGATPDTLGDLLAHLEREGRIVRAPSDLWFDAEAIEALRGRVRAHFQEHDQLDTPAYKAIIGTSRRTAVPLMELLDNERLTARRGAVRVLRVRGND